MTVQEMIGGIGAHWIVLLVTFIGLPVSVLVFGKVHGKGRGERTPFRYVYTVMVYVACIPGIFAVVLTAYMMLFLRGDLLTANVLVYFLPMASMAASVLIMRKNVDLAKVPGFDRLVGLCILLAITGGILLLLVRLRFLVGFFGSMASLLVIGAFVFVLLKWATHRAFRPRGEERQEPPKFPEL